MNIKDGNGESVGKSRHAFCGPTRNREFFEALEAGTSGYQKYDVELLRGNGEIEVICRHKGSGNERFTIELTGMELCALIYNIQIPLDDNDDGREGTISIARMKTELKNAVGHLYGWYFLEQKKEKKDGESV